MKKIKKFWGAAALFVLAASVLLTVPGRALADYIDTYGTNIGAYAVAVGPAGDVFIADNQAHSILKMNALGTISTFADGFTSAGPYGVAVDSQGNVYATDGGDYSITKFNAGGQVVWKNSNDPGDGNYSVGGIVDPRGLALDSAGIYLYYSDHSGSSGRGYLHRIRTSDGSMDSGWGSEALYSPWGIAIDSSGYIYAAEWGATTVVKVDGGGHIVTRFQGNQAYTAFGGPAGVAVDAAGNVYVADTNNSRIVRFDSTGNNLTVLGTGFYHPMGVALEISGAPNVIVADWNNGQVKRLYPRPVVTGISPTSGSAAGGTTVTIYGQSLANPSKVYFGTQQAVILNASNPGSITVSAPVCGPGPLDVTVQGVHETSAVSASAVYDSIGPADAVKSAVSVSPQTGITANGSDASTVTVTVRDSASQLLSGHTITLTQNGNAMVSPAGGITDASGIVTFTVRDTKAETVTLTATDTMDGVVLSQKPTVTFVAGPPAAITVAGGNSQTAVKNDIYTAALQAKVVDANGNPVSGKTVTFTAPASGAGGTFMNGTNQDTETTGPDGIATSSTFTANGTVGSYTVTAGVAGVGTTANFSLKNLPGLPSNITWVVNDLGDGPGSSSNVTLRYALQQAQSDIGDKITFSVTGTITLMSPLPVIHEFEDLTIEGPGAGSLTVSGNNQYRVFEVEGGTVSISNLTIADGKTVGNKGGDGNAYNDSTRVACGGGGGGGAGAGGGLLVLDGSVAIQSVDFRNCQAVGGTGGAPGSGLWHLDSFGTGYGGDGGTDYKNTAGGAGGAPGTSSNRDGQSGGNGGDFAGGGGGGGILATSFGLPGPGGSGGFSGGNGGSGLGLTYAEGYFYAKGGAGGSGCGGALFADKGTVTVADCTFSGNSALGGAGGTGSQGGNAYGGAVFVNTASVSFANSTFTGNSVTGALGTAASIYNKSGSVPATNVTWDQGDSIYPQAAMPVAVPGDGNMLRSGSTITLTDSTAGSTIYYTLDGTTPTASSASGSGSGTQVTISGNPGDNVIVKTLVSAPGFFDRTAEFRYIIAGNVLTVTDLSDGAGSISDITLRYALLQSQLNNGLTIQFGASGVITLISPLPAISWDVAIDGAGQAVSISGNDQIRVFRVDGGNVTIKNLTIEHGLALGGNGSDGSDSINEGYSVSGGGGGGGGGGSCGPGGGLLVMGGSVGVDHVVFSANSAKGGNGGNGGHSTGLAYGYGGSGGNGGGSDVNNATGGVGGGGGNGGSGDQGANAGGDFAGGGGGGGGSGATGWGYGGTGGSGGFGGGNGGNGGKGWGIYDSNHNGSGGNGGDGLGGAIYMDEGSLTIQNSSFENNTVSGGPGGSGESNGTNGNGFGAAIYNRNGTVTVPDNSNTFGTGSSVYNAALPAYQLVWQTQPGDSVKDGALSTAPVLALKDACGNIITSDNTSTVTVSLTTPNGANLSGATVTVAGGIATFGNLSVDKTGTYTLTATCGSITSAASNPFTVYKNLVSVEVPAAVTQVPNGTQKTAQTLGLPSKVILETSEGNMQADVVWNLASCSYDPDDIRQQTFTVGGTVTLPDGVKNTNSVSLDTTVSVTVNTAASTDKTLVSISSPASITGVAHCEEKTAAAFGLPGTVTMITNYGNVQAAVTWDAASYPYDPANTAQQSFTVHGTASLPDGVQNPGGVSLAVSVSVTVNAGQSPVNKTLVSVSAPADVIGLPNGSPKTVAGLGLPAKVTLVTDAGDVLGDVSWDAASCAYDPESSSVQIVTVSGLASLPLGVANPNHVSLSVIVTVNTVPPDGDDGFYRTIQPPDIAGVPNGTQKTAAALGLPCKTLVLTAYGNQVMVDVSWNVDSCPYDPAIITAQTFAVNGTATLPAWMYDYGIYGKDVLINVTVHAADAGSRALQSVTAPAGITGLTNGTAKTAAGLGLPQTIALQTDAGIVNAGATWDVAASAYHPSIKTAQTFTVSGAVSLPYGTVNPGKVDLHTAVNVTVDAEKYVLTVLAGNGGSITQGNGGLYAAGEQIAITVAPDTNYGFGGWSSSGGGTFADANSLSTTFTMPAAAATVRAIFTPPRTVTDTSTGVSIRGGINESAQLKVTPIAEDSVEYKALVAAMNHGGQRKKLILTFDISLEQGGPGQTYLGELALFLPVGAQYNGQTLTLLHYVNGTVEEYLGVVANGLLTVMVTHLSPFAVAVSIPEPTPTASNTPTASPTPAPSTDPSSSPGKTAGPGANSGPAITISGIPDSGTLFVGGRIKLIPSVSGGMWIYDHSLLSLTKNSDGTVTMKGLKEGTTTLVYTVGYVSIQITVTILAAGLPQTGQDFTSAWVLLILTTCVFMAAIVVARKNIRAKTGHRKRS